MECSIFISKPIILANDLFNLHAQCVENILSHITDRKVTKSISLSASYGLTAVQKLKKTLNMLPANSYRRGIFAAAPAPYTSDKEVFFELAKKSASEGSASLKYFAEHLDEVFPTSSLMGLPNGSLCFAAHEIGALGPHGCYLDLDCATHNAFSAAVTHVKLNRLDDFVVYGFCHTAERFFAKSASEVIRASLRSTLGGYAVYGSADAKKIEDPVAEIKNIQCAVPIRCFLQSKLKKYDLILLSCPLEEVVQDFFRLFKGTPVVDVYAQAAYLSEMAGVLEISMAKKLEVSKEVKINALCLIVCVNPWEMVSSLEFILK